MSFVRSSKNLLRPHFRLTTTQSSCRTFTSTTVRVLKEDHKDPSPEETERLKQEQLKKQEKGEGHWHEGLASAGESSVKADRQEVDDHDKHMEELQQHGKEKAHKGEL
ncbi:hypothetical protein NA57DRAFT_57177 [Rhizodiscina lignyota]|uniref:Mitochondrial carrier protein pet8 n=1 Tax=Rhizodiscina lignyota TaxID=1504668 RepID=A0A9P4M858_9PEZI|nr:hypothetical protein NA57DRAFT_57177 [Rhizodiscina lignyota]